MIEILLAEDNPHDVRFVEQALKSGKLLHNLHVVRDGEDALDFLYKRAPYESVPRPDLILLDLNMPNLSGQEVLEEIKHDKDLLSIPTVVLTSSDADGDIVNAYKTHVNAYIVKPVDFKKFFDIVRKIEDFWLVIVKRPPK